MLLWNCSFLTGPTSIPRITSVDRRGRYEKLEEPVSFHYPHSHQHWCRHEPKVAMLHQRLLPELWMARHLQHILTPWSRVLLEKLTGSAASQEISRIFGIQKFLTVLTSALHLSISWANSIQSPQPPPTSWRSILILSFHLRLGSPQWSLSLRFPHQNPVHSSPLPHTRHMPRPSHSSRFYHPHNVG